MLKFKVESQVIERCDNFAVVADSKNYLYAEFEFSDEWTGEVTAIFGDGDQYYCVLLKDKKCLIPWEVISPPFFTVSVVCGDRITANTAMVEVERSGYVEGKTPKEPTPDVYTQILSLAKPPYIGENENWYVWDKTAEAFIDTGIYSKGDRGNDGYTPKRGVDYWTANDIAEVQGYINEQLGVIENGSY